MSWRLDSDGGHIDKALVPIDVRNLGRAAYRAAQHTGPQTGPRSKQGRAAYRAYKDEAQVTRARGIIGGS